MTLRKKPTSYTGLWHPKGFLVLQHSQEMPSEAAPAAGVSSVDSRSCRRKQQGRRVQHMLLPRGLGTATAATLAWPPGFCQAWGQGQRAVPFHTQSGRPRGWRPLKAGVTPSPILLICGLNQMLICGLNQMLESLGKADVCGKQGLALQLPTGCSSAHQFSISGAP